MIGVGFGHFGPVSLDKARPLSRRLGSLCQFHRFEARCQGGKPDVVPILCCEVCLGNTTRWPTDRSNTKTLSFDARRPQSYNTDNQDTLLTFDAQPTSLTGTPCGATTELNSDAVQRSPSIAWVGLHVSRDTGLLASSHEPES